MGIEIEPTIDSRGKAAGIWCEPQHSHKIFDPELAESIAAALLRERVQVRDVMLSEDAVIRAAKQICAMQPCACGSAEKCIGPMKYIRQQARAALLAAIEGGPWAT